ncbi:hypothetical protein SPRG_01290 [Saprolegnia parasitica CBS 223.65]|uniref:PX domain-containing protein n=1 Tax=Saprolegnia parasitica (strain CBS 223.65) TaxID=695850 RepID=A0A067D5M8_SAPPC|nr:hypothetical protein SPRG_01290 [Saprolegnia parasitica CBS 223.65]KDO34016.1 hypothetical protein SPRG_01290 [Saprolegnia parasitica CBS 223.65]|eukprot:XP_012194901.1 hypothetical protein SPRG_01290 [Saprolegnia parasitica CBS 223.65]
MAKDTNIFTKVSAKIIKTKVPPLFSTGLSTTYVLQVHNAATDHSFRIGKTYTDFVVLRDQLLRAHDCDNGALCAAFSSDMHAHFPPKVLMHRHADVVHLREWKFQDLLDLVVRFINASRSSTCAYAREAVPNSLIVFLFDGAKMDKRKFWIPLQRTHRGRRIPRAVIEEAIRIARDNHGVDEDDEVNERHMGSIDSILESHGSVAVVESVLDAAGSPGCALDVGTPEVANQHRENNNASLDDDDDDAIATPTAVAGLLHSLRKTLEAIDDAKNLAALEDQVKSLFRDRHTQLHVSTH